jgi:hypothetical protein
MWLFGYFLHVSGVVMLSALREIPGYPLELASQKRSGGRKPAMSRRPTANGCGNKATQCDYASFAWIPSESRPWRKIGVTAKEFAPLGRVIEPVRYLTQVREEEGFFAVTAFVALCGTSRPFRGPDAKYQDHGSTGHNTRFREPREFSGLLMREFRLPFRGWLNNGEPR